MQKLYYLRHGLSKLNTEHLICGVTDSPLVEAGRAGATAEGQNFRKQNIKLDKIYASPLSRAHETAKLFAEGAGINPEIIVVDELLIERNFGVLEKTPYSPDITVNLLNDDLPEGTEKWDDVIRRAERMLKKAEADDGIILLVGHGSIGRALKKVVSDHPEYPKSHDWKEHIPNSTIFELI